MKTYFTASILGALASAEFVITESMEFMFMSFIARNNRSYESIDEYQLRRELFNKTHAFI